MDRSVTAQGLVAGGLLVVLLVTVGCSGDGYVVSDVQIDRRGWDTLDVTVAFARSGLLGGSSVSSDDTSIVLFDASYDTLYADVGRFIVFDDRVLGDRERLMLEVCGTFGATSVCEQRGVTASPKRVRVEHAITYPEDAAYERGSYDLRFVVERKAFAEDAWEPIHRSARVSGYLLAYVGGQSGDAVKVPFSRTRGRFDLTRDPHFKDFRFHLQSQLYDTSEAPVHFDVYAGLNDQPPVRLTTVEMLVREKTEEERRAEVTHFARDAGRRILERLGVDEGDRTAFAYVDDWAFKPLTNTYLIDLELLWRADSRFFGRRHWLEGVLDVKEDGSSARFQYRDANDRVARRWRRSVRGETLVLGPLEPYVHEEEPDEDEDQQQAVGGEASGQRGIARIE